MSRRLRPVPPTVLSESNTLELVRLGQRSLARFGDGELSILMCRHDAPGQAYSKGLAKRLAEVAACRDTRLVVAAPRIYRGAQIPPHMRRSWLRWTDPGRIPPVWSYAILGSAFVTRPDFYGKPFGMDYWRLMRSIWEGRPMLLVRGNARKPQLFHNASSVEVLVGPRPDAWRDYRAILSACELWSSANRDGIVVAMLGPTATVLAHDLALQGVQCLDLGKAATFYRHELREAADA